MIGTFYNCSNIIGPAKCSDNVISMKSAYYNCVNLIGEPACGEKVKTLEDAFKFIELGATRLGTSSGVAIMNDTCECCKEEK